MSLIPSDNVFAILASLFGLCILGILSEKTRVGQRVSGAVIIIFLAALASNIHLIPASAPLYGVIWKYAVPLAVALYLIHANLYDIFLKGGRVLIGFGFGAVGAILASLLGPSILNLGADGPAYAAIFGATFTGGALNFAAVAESIGFQDPTKLAAAVAIDNVLGVAYFVVLGSAATSVVFSKFLPDRHKNDINSDNIEKRVQELNLLDLTISLGIAASACAIGQYIAILLGFENYWILTTTFLMIVFATIFGRRLENIRSPKLIATLLMYLFFALLGAGAGADISAMLNSAPELFLFVLLILGVHVLFIVVGAKICRLSFSETIVASSACIGGPPIAVAFAILFGWKKLVTPGVVTGVLGYAVGNFIGIGIFSILS